MEAWSTSVKIEIDKEVLQAVLDVAVGSMDFGSGFLDLEEIEALRTCAEVLGVDPMDVTPEKMQCSFGAPHTMNTFVWGGLPPGSVCTKCRHYVSKKNRKNEDSE